MKIKMHIHVRKGIFIPETVSENHLSVNDPFESDFEFRRGAADTVKGFFGKKLSENV